QRGQVSALAPAECPTVAGVGVGVASRLSGGGGRACCANPNLPGTRRAAARSAITVHTKVRVVRPARETVSENDRPELIKRHRRDGGRGVIDLEGRGDPPAEISALERRSQIVET